MSVHGLVLQHFRCHKQLNLKFGASAFEAAAQVTVVVGNNAVGKTSVIEALSLLSTGESFRAERDEDMIAFGQELARVKTKVGEDELEVVLTRGVLQGKAVQRKHYFVNGTRRRKKDFLGHFTTVVFRPEDMRLIEGSPTRRRQFIDTILAVVHPHYGTSLTTYENALKRRNKLIDQVRDGNMPKTVLNYWTQLLLKHGQLIQEHRRQFFSQFSTAEFPLQFRVEYVPSVVSEERFLQYAEKEIAAGHTLIGSHKDDFLVNFLSTANDGWIDVSQFGSRGQQRLAVLWLKLSELQYVEQYMGLRPLLLLDDILSELDREHRKQVEELLNEGQAVVTTTEDSVAGDLRQRIPNLQLIQL
ncbi:AAA family ATPase [Patescibacteria group bacterium]|nr:AAA family ATPase [Patescibacteria group bacterium]